MTILKSRLSGLLFNLYMDTIKNLIINLSRNSKMFNDKYFNMLINNKNAPILIMNNGRGGYIETGLNEYDEYSIIVQQGSS